LLIDCFMELSHWLYYTDSKGKSPDLVLKNGPFFGQIQ
jgi:hypothetical protein